MGQAWIIVKVVGLVTVPKYAG